MTMIACTMNKAAPIIIGDLLISASVKQDKFVIPVLTDDVLQYLSKESEIQPICLNQKTYILKSNVCAAFSGKVFYINQFLEDISIFCRVHETIDTEKMNQFLEQHQNNDSWKHFSFLILVVNKENQELGVGRFMHGDWFGVESNVFGEVFASGSGSLDFLKEIKGDTKILTQFPQEDISYALQVNIIMLCKLLSKERLTLDSIRRHWGAGFEIIYFDKDHFTKLDDVTYVVNHGMFNTNGDIKEVPVPVVILHYKYHDEILVITVIKTHHGTTTITENKYIITCNDCAIMQFIVMPINYQGLEDFNDFAKNPSFTSTRIAMGYIIETPSGHYLPASFNVGSELEIKYEHPNNIIITMMEGINDMLVSEAKQIFPNLL